MSRIITFLILILFVQLTFGQATKVRGEGELSLSQKAKQDIEYNQILPLENEYNELIKKLDLSWVRSVRGFSGLDDRNTINRIKNENQEILNKINSNPRLKSIISQLTSLYKQVGSSRTIGVVVFNNEKNAKENIRRANQRLAELDGKKQQQVLEDDKDRQLDKKLDDIDAEIEAIEKSSSADKSIIDEYNKNNKNKSIDDFLAPGKKTSNTTEIDDFLTEDQSTEDGEDGDFLAIADKEQEAKKSEETAKVDSKGSMQGVIDAKGKILIPYRNWKVSEYKEGIAKVKVKIDDYECLGTHMAYKVGFVDKSGEYLDDVKIEFTSYVTYEQPAYLTITKNDKKSYETWDEYYDRKDREKRAGERRRKEEKRKKALEKARCEKQVDAWKSNIINQYK